MNRSVFVVAASAILAATALVVAGDLNPPVGPVAPTMKDLDTVEPRIPIGPDTTPGDADSLFRISQAGSYYLTGNVTGVSGLHGIEISASNVSIDLMGFTLRGVPGSLTGIRTDAASSNITISRGGVSSWGNDGIDLIDASFAGSGCLIEAVHASNNGDFGIRSCHSAVIRNCTAVSNGGIGIVGFSNAQIESCSARLNGSNGFVTGSASTIRGCSAFENLGNGFVTSETSLANCTASHNGSDGFSVGTTSNISNCAASFNTNDGIQANAFCVVQNNTCESNGQNTNGAGIRAMSVQNRIEGNNCILGSRGVEVIGTRNLIIRNSCADNAINYIIGSGNALAPIVSATTNPAIVIGSLYAGNLGTTDPWANFSY